VYGGATVCAWYPITPSSSVAEAFQKYCKKYRHDPETGEARYAIVQAEDEIASIGMVVGAGWNGARSFTATSGPGVSLMTEFIGLAYFAEIPVTIINVQRGGPSTGMPTRTQQADLLSSAYASHGDTKHVMLLPQDPARMLRVHAPPALDLADRLQTPVFVMTDLDIGMNQRLCAPFAWDEAREYDRGKVMTPRSWKPARTSAATRTSTATASPGARCPARTRPRALLHARHHARRLCTLLEAGPDYLYNVQRLLKKFATAATLVPQPVLRRRRRRRRAWACSTSAPPAPAMDEALDRAGRRGHPPRRDAAARLPVPAQPWSASSSPTTTTCSWSSRTATRRCAAC
jgi:2-oxoglutarate ferredoxin oxidoreductase subunit alpha